MWTHNQDSPSTFQEQELYQKEGLGVNEVHYVDNQDCIGQFLLKHLCFLQTGGWFSLLYIHSAGEYKVDFTCVCVCVCVCLWWETAEWYVCVCVWWETAEWFLSVGGSNSRTKEFLFVELQPCYLDNSSRDCRGGLIDRACGGAHLNPCLFAVLLPQRGQHRGVEVTGAAQRGGTTNVLNET